MNVTEFGAMGRDFSSLYPKIVEKLISEGSVVSSRAGDTREFLNFVTRVTNPYERLTGGNGRGINAFFLIAEAIWIVAGQRDVAFLNIFNSNMKTFSDDGNVFHAPYGFRLRSYGKRAEDNSIIPPAGLDQIEAVVRILSENADDRRAVMSIWNAEQDLGVQSKDIPCNDMVMLKVRDGELHTTICNRSNDIHWGLPTNIFQFSFLSEIIAACLGVRLGTQTHISQSLHVYDWNDLTDKMASRGFSDATLYSDGAVSTPIDFNFTMEAPVSRLKEISHHIESIVEVVRLHANGRDEGGEYMMELFKFSRTLYSYAKLLIGFVRYRYAFVNSQDQDSVRAEALSEVRANCIAIEDACSVRVEDWDVYRMCASFFVSRIKNKKHLEKLENSELLSAL